MTWAMADTPLRIGNRDYRFTVHDPGSEDWIYVYIHVGKDGQGSVTDINSQEGKPLSEYPFPVDEGRIVTIAEKIQQERERK